MYCFKPTAQTVTRAQSQALELWGENVTHCTYKGGSKWWNKWWRMYLEISPPAIVSFAFRKCLFPVEALMFGNGWAAAESNFLCQTMTRPSTSFPVKEYRDQCMNLWASAYFTSEIVPSDGTLDWTESYAVIVLSEWTDKTSVQKWSVFWTESKMHQQDACLYNMW